MVLQRLSRFDIKKIKYNLNLKKVIERVYYISCIGLDLYNNYLRNRLDFSYLSWTWL